MLAIGWGLAAMLGAVAGMLTAPSAFLEPTMMQPILIYAFAAAVLGGIDSPVGAIVGGLLLGVGLNLSEILFGAGPFPNFAKSKDTLPAWAVQKTFEYFQVPYTAAYYGSTSSTIRVRPGHWGR